MNISIELEIIANYDLVKWKPEIKLVEDLTQDFKSCANGHGCLFRNGKANNTNAGFKKFLLAAADFLDHSLCNSIEPIQ